MELQDYLHIFIKYLRISLLGALIAGAIGAAANIATDYVPLYSATSAVLVGGDVATVEQNQDYRALADQFSTTYADLATRDPVLQGVIKNLGLNTTPDDLKDYVSATVVDNTQLIEITASDNKASTAAAIANSTAQNLVNFSPKVVRNFVLLVENAPVPTFPSLAFFLIPMVAAVLGFLLVGGTAFLLEFLRNPVYSADELSRRTNLPVLATVRNRPKAQNRLERSQNRQLPKWRKVSETLWWPLVQTSRRNFNGLALETNSHPKKPLVLVTSPTDFKEKGLVAANLAATWAKTGEKVILVEADLNEPKLHKYFKIDHQPGLAELLKKPASSESIQQMLLPTDMPGLSVLPAGNVDKGSSDGLTSQSFAQIVQELSKFADAIVVNGPAMLANGNGALLATQAHGVLLAVKSGRTSMEAIEDARDALEMADSHLWGAILVDGVVSK